MGLCTGKERVKERSPLREWESDVTWQQTRQLVFAILTDNTERLWSQILPCAFNADFPDPVLYNSLCHCKLSAVNTGSLTDLLTYSEETRKSSRSHNHSIDCFLLWPFNPPNIKTKMMCAWLSESGIPFPDRRKHKRSVSVRCHPHPPLAHARTLAHLTPDFVSWVSFWWVA